MLTSFMMCFQWERRISILFYSITYCILILLASAADIEGLKFKILSGHVKVLIVLGSRYSTWQTKTNHFGSSTQVGLLLQTPGALRIQVKSMWAGEIKEEFMWKAASELLSELAGIWKYREGHSGREKTQWRHERMLFVYQWIFNPG